MTIDSAALLEASLDKLTEPAETVAAAAEAPAEGTEPAGPTEAEAEATEPVEGEQASEPAESEEEATEEVPEDLDPLKAALAKHKAPRLEDLPEEARPLVEKRLKEMNAAFTRAQQEATTFRAEQAEYQARKAWESEHPVDAIVERLISQPRLLELVNEELTKLAEPVYAEAKTRERDTNQKIARLEAEERRREVEFYETRAADVEAFTESTAAAQGVPFALIEPLVAAAIEKNRQITNEQVAEIIAHQAAIYRRSVGAHKREAKKTLAKLKVQDKKSAGLVVKPGASSASAPVPATKKLPQAASSEDRLTASLDRLGIPA